MASMIYAETVVQWVSVPIDDEDAGMTSSELEEKYRESIMIAINEDGWDGAEVLENDFRHGEQ